jgi:hypothetical protein
VLITIPVFVQLFVQPWARLSLVSSLVNYEVVRLVLLAVGLATLKTYNDLDHYCANCVKVASARILAPHEPAGSLLEASEGVLA